MMENWLSDEEYKKAEGQLRGTLRGIMACFNQYGLDAFVPGAIAEIVKASVDFSLRLRGFDKPISLEYIRRQKNALPIRRNNKLSRGKL